MLPGSPSFEIRRFLDELTQVRQGRTRFPISVAAVIAALTATVITQWMFGHVAVLVFAVVVIGCTALLGPAAGLCSVLISVLILDYFYIPPQFELSLDLVTLRVAALLTGIAGSTAVVARLASKRLAEGIRQQIRGTFDGIEGGQVSGWVLDKKQPSRPVLVTIFLDKLPVANVAAVHYRPDVERVMQCSGQHGFYVDLSAYFPVPREVVLDVRLSNGTPLQNAPCKVSVPAVRPRPLRKTVLFMHIPKTAGTAFREAIASNFLESEIAYLYPHSPGFLVNDLRALPLEQRRGYRMVIGHFQYGMHEALSQSSEYVTIVREPAARVLSQVAYLKQTRPDLTCDARGREITLEQLFASGLCVDVDNTLVRLFSGVDEKEMPPGRVTLAAYEQALYNLRSHFAFVGHQEASAAAYAWLQTKYGWYATSDLAPVNVGKMKESVRPTPELLELIRTYNQWDFALYSQILKLFPMSRLVV